MELQENDIVEVTDCESDVYGMLGTVAKILVDGQCLVRLARRHITLNGTHDDKRLFYPGQITKRGHADWFRHS